MINHVTLDDVAYDNLISNKKHKDMIYLCNFGISKII